MTSKRLGLLQLGAILGLVALLSVIERDRSVEPSEPTSSPTAAVSTLGLTTEQQMLEDLENADYIEDCTFPPVIEEPPATTAERITHGSELFVQNCSVCHGPNSTVAAGALDPPPTKLRKPESYKHGSDAKEIYRTIYYGVDGTAMAPWGDAFDDGANDVWDIVFFVQALQGEDGATHWRELEDAKGRDVLLR